MAFHRCKCDLEITAQSSDNYTASSLSPTGGSKFRSARVSSPAGRSFGRLDGLIGNLFRTDLPGSNI
ncbi:hypothetical protein Csa_012309 [Cucumis sativus]|uniref:Uncharacterized protein n=1 Tax=Cucumis sativus TaxID=3659 RepID=A0A0A0L164_CUCSA|nr:hypothetical protein Csa_012309 [Cucumis sativus]